MSTMLTRFEWRKQVVTSGVQFLFYTLLLVAWIIPFYSFICRAVSNNVRAVLMLSIAVLIFCLINAQTLLNIFSFRCRNVVPSLLEKQWRYIFNLCEQNYSLLCLPRALNRMLVNKDIYISSEPLLLQIKMYSLYGIVSEMNCLHMLFQHRAMWQMSFGWQYSSFHIW